MNISKRIFTLFISVLSFISLQLAAQSVPKFESLIYNFGNVEEDKGMVSHEFVFINKGPNILQIDTVEPECGCTTSKWSKDSIEVDESGTVLASFNPKGLSGNFQKEIIVKFKGLSNPSRLRLIGNVVPGISDPKAYYKKKIGGTRFRSNYFSIGPVQSDSSVERTFDVYNDTDTVLTFLDQINHPSHIKVSIEPMILNPGQTGKIRVYFDAKALNKLGFTSDLLTIATDELNRNAIKYLNISANVMYAFPEMNELEKKNAANIKFESLQHDFGKLIEGEIVEKKFKFTNIGKENLEILQTSASCGCTAGVSDKDLYQPGESGEIKVTFNSRNRNGFQNKFITVYSNSPLNPVVELKITAQVEKNVPEGE